MRELEGFLKAALSKKASVKSKVLLGGGLLAGGAIIGAKAQQGLGRSQILQGDAYRRQARQRRLEQEGSLTG